VEVVGRQFEGAKTRFRYAEVPETEVVRGLAPQRAERQ